MVSKQDVFMEDAKAETVQYQPGMISSSNHSGLTQSVRVGAREMGDWIIVGMMLLHARQKCDHCNCYLSVHLSFWRTYVQLRKGAATVLALAVPPHQRFTCEWPKGRLIRSTVALKSLEVLTDRQKEIC